MIKKHPKVYTPIEDMGSNNPMKEVLDSLKDFYKKHNAEAAIVIFMREIPELSSDFPGTMVDYFSKDSFKTQEGPRNIATLFTVLVAELARNFSYESLKQIFEEGIALSRETFSDS